jgi:uncharacterized protein (TIGR02118 family)
MVKLVAFVKRKAGMSREEFYEHWEERHAPLIAGTPELARHIVRYEQHRRTPDADWMGTEEFDGITIQWMTSPAAFEAFIAEPKYAELVAPDEQRFLDTASLVWMVTDEPRIAIDGPFS